MRPHRWQPTRLHHPWDSPGKNCSGLPFPSPKQESENWKWSLSCVCLLVTLWTAAYRHFRPWDFPSKSTGVGCHCLLKCVNLVLFTSKFPVSPQTLTSWSLGATLLQVHVIPETFSCTGTPAHTHVQTHACTPNNRQVEKQFLTSFWVPIT